MQLIPKFQNSGKIPNLPPEFFESLPKQGEIRQGEGKQSTDTRSSAERNKDYLHPLRGMVTRNKSTWENKNHPIQGIVKTAAPAAIGAAAAPIMAAIAANPGTWTYAAGLAGAGYLEGNALNLAVNDRLSTDEENVRDAALGMVVPTVLEGVAKPAIKVIKDSKVVNNVAKFIDDPALALTKADPRYKQILKEHAGAAIKHQDLLFKSKKGDMEKLIGEQGPLPRSEFLSKYKEYIKTSTKETKEAVAKYMFDDFSTYLKSKNLDLDIIKRDPDLVNKHVDKFIKKQNTSVRGVSFDRSPDVESLKKSGYNSVSPKALGGDMLGTRGVYTSNSAKGVAVPYTRGNGRVFYVQDQYAEDLISSGLTPDEKLTRLGEKIYSDSRFRTSKYNSNNYQRAYFPTKEGDLNVSENLKLLNQHDYHNPDLVGGHYGMIPSKPNSDKGLFLNPNPKTVEIIRGLTNKSDIYDGLKFNVAANREHNKLQAVNKIKNELLNPYKASVKDWGTKGGVFIPSALGIKHLTSTYVRDGKQLKEFKEKWENLPEAEKEALREQRDAQRKQIYKLASQFDLDTRKGRSEFRKARQKK